MKTRKILGNLLAGLGGVLFFVGLFALLLPKSQNQQLQLLLSSFRTPTDNFLLQWMNNGMNAAMAHSTSVIIAGLVLTVLGMLLIFSVRTTTTAQQAQPRRQAVAPVPAAMPVQANPFARTQPAAAESNPFARYIAPDTLPKSTEVRTPAAARTEEPLPEAFAPLADSEPAPTLEQPEEVLYGLVDDEDDYEDDLSVDGYYPLQLDEDEDDEAEDDEGEEQPVAEAPAAEDEPEPCELPEEEPEPAMETEAQPEPAEEGETFFTPSRSAGAADVLISETPAVEEEPEQELIFTPEAPEAAPETALDTVSEAVAESAPEAPADSAAPEQAPDTPAQPVTAGAAAPAGLRPAIRSTFRKSTVGSSAGSQPVSRIKSTMGHKR